MKMNKALGLAIAVSGLIASTAQAALITGGVSLAGSYVTDTGDLNTATKFNSFDSVLVVGASGSYLTAGVVFPQAVIMNGFSFNPFPSGGVNPLWITAVGPLARFDLGSPITVTQLGDDFLTLEGNGTLSLDGYDPTPGTWTFTANQDQGAGIFAFNASHGAVPDGGSTLILLGGALIGLVSIVNARK